MFFAGDIMNYSKRMAVYRYRSELLAMSHACKDTSENRCVYLNIDGGAQKRPREIGRMLHKLGGIHAMKDVGMFIQKSTKVYNNGIVADCWSDSRMLDICWDGIGEWKC